jgi:hypothetical protein
MWRHYHMLKEEALTQQQLPSQLDLGRPIVQTANH